MYTLNIIKNYKVQSIFFKYLKTLVVFFVIPFIILTSVIIFMYNHSVSKEVNHTFSQSFQKSYSYIESIYEETEKQWHQISINSSFLSMAYEPSVTKNSRISKELINLINTFQLSSRGIYGIDIYFLNSDYVISTYNSNYFDKFIHKDTFEFFLKHPSDNTAFHNGAFNICYPLFGSYGKTPCAYVLFRYDTGHLKNQITAQITDEHFLLTDSESNIIFSDDLSLCGQKVTDKNIIKSLKNPNISIKNEKTMYISDILKRNGYRLTGITSNVSSATAQTTKAVIILIILFSVLLASGLAFYIAYQFYYSIADIASKFEPEYFDNNINNDEIKYINQNIVKIMNENKIIEEQLYESMSALKHAQHIALQAQINPHFLLNTLNLASLIIMNIVRKENDAEKVLLLLSNLLYTALDTNKYIVTVEDEINYVRKFIEIEELRYKNKFEIIYDIAEETKNMKCIKMILQPIVENAFEYGIKPLKKKKGSILIKVYSENESLYFSVKDNGIGMEESKLTELNTRMKSNKIAENKHIGLSNVNQRIKLLYGENYGCSIKSNTDGTTVTLKLPSDKA